MKRLKRRYLLLQIDDDVAVGERDLIDAIWVAVTRLYGEFGASLSCLALIKYDSERRLAVVRTNKDAADIVRVALATMISIGGKPTAVHVIGVAGTIKSLCSKSKFL